MSNNPQRSNLGLGHTIGINRRHFGVKSLAAVSSLLLTGASHIAVAQNRVEKIKINIGVTSATAFSYLPLVVGQQMGFFEDEGLAVELVDFPSSLRAQQALVSGNADVVCGLFEHLLSLHVKNQYAQSFVALGQTPQIAMGVSTKNMPNYRRLSDLRGKKIGIAAPGTGTSVFVNILLQRAGFRQNEVSYIGVGTSAGALSAIRSGQIDALCNLEPVMTQLEQQREVKIIAEARTLRGTQAIFGGAMPGACLFALPDYIQKNRQTVQALTNAVLRALKWLENASVRDLLRQMPESVMLGDRNLFLATYQNIRESISTDGELNDEAARLSLKILSTYDGYVKAERLDISKIYTNTYAKQAKSKFDA